jgi:hypothetical protein
MLEIALLAASAVRILAPYIKRGAEGMADAIEDRAEGGAADFAVGVATSVWARVRGAFEASGQESTVKEFEQNPDDAQEYFEKRLKHLLESDEGFARELDELVSKEAPDGRNVIQIMSSSGVVAVTGDVTGDGIVAGSIGTIHQGPAPPPPPTREE